MSTWKEKLLSGCKAAGKLPQKIASWSQKTQIIVAASTAGTLMVASVGGVAIYQHNNAAETVAEEADTQVQVVEAADTEVLVSTEIIDIPDYVACAITSDSIEKDLTLYIKGADNKKIQGEAFEIKLIDPDDADALSDALDAIDDINDRLDALAENGGDTDAEEETADDSEVSIDSTTGSGTLTLDSAGGEEGTEASADSNTAAGADTVYVSSLTGEELTAEEELLLEKEKAIQAYADALLLLDGDIYTDSDGDGMIYIESITDGDYVACLVPADSYDADSYAVDVNVKEKIEYKAVENIEDKTVSEAAAGDVEETHEEIVVEAVAADTVEYVESKTVKGAFAATTAAVLKASVSSELNTAAAALNSSSSGGDDTQNTETESGTTETESETTQASETTTTETTSETTTSETTTSETTTSETISDTTETTSVISGKVYLTAANDSTGSTLSVNKSATVYSDVTGANSVSITVKSTNVTGVTVTSNNSGLTVKGSGSSYTLTAAGITKDTTVTVTVSGTDVNQEKISVVCTVTVMGSKNQLQDADGNLLYMDELGETIAYYKDYSASATYYYDSDEVIYYGWQTIDGTRYYFDKNGNKVTGTQTISGITYSFGSDGALLTSGYGIDVSKWQGSIDWAQASTAVSFAIIRAGYRGSSGNMAVDSYAGTNIKNATANGVKVGLYIYSRAVNEVQAVEEASLAISIAKQYGGISYPIYIDMEADNQKSLSTAQRDAIVLAFCTTVKNAGYQAGVYANKNWLTNYLTPSSYTGYSIWCAQYNTSCTYTGRYDIWQYSSKGSIPGISGNVDLDKSYF